MKYLPRSYHPPSPTCQPACNISELTLLYNLWRYDPHKFARVCFSRKNQSDIFFCKGTPTEPAENVEKACFNLNFFNRIGSKDMWCNHTERRRRNADLSLSSVSPDRTERCNMGAINYGHTFSLRCCIVFSTRLIAIEAFYAKKIVWVACWLCLIKKKNCHENSTEILKKNIFELR